MEVEIDGRKYRAVTAAEMRELDRRAIEEFGIPGLALMENAGRGMAERIKGIYRERRCSSSVMVLCGKGNNGGDGFVIARHLHNAGLPVRVYFLGEEGTGDAGINRAIAGKLRMNMRAIKDGKEIAEALKQCRTTGIVVDALLGTGLANKVSEPIAGIISLVNAVRPHIVAVDTPSGLDCTTGEVLGVAVRAHETLTCGLPKVGFFKAEGPRHVGKLHVVDISLPREML